MDDLVGRGVGAARFERAAPGGGEGQHAPEGEHVGLRPDLLGGLELLGCHERWRSDDSSGLGERMTIHGAGNAEIDDARAILGQKDIAGLEIAVDHACAMNVTQRTGQRRG
jgi:hypothetical protein